MYIRGIRLLVVLCVLFFGSLIVSMAQKTPEEISSLIADLKDPNIEKRQNAVDQLGRIRPTNPAIVQSLILALSDKAPDIRRAAISSLGEIGTSAIEAAPKLLEILGNKKGDVSERIKVIHALEKIRPNPTDVLPIISRIVKDKEEEMMVRAIGVSFIGKIGIKAKEELPLLNGIAKDNTEPTLLRVKAWAAIAKVGGESKQVVDLLLKTVEEQRGNIAGDHAIVALHDIGEGKKLIPFYLRQLASGSSVEKIGAALGLGEIGPDASEAVPSLTNTLKDKDPSIRAVAASALGKIGSAAEQAIPALKSISVNDPSERVRSVAKEAVEKIQADKRSK